MIESHVANAIINRVNSGGNLFERLSIHIDTPFGRAKEQANQILLDIKEYNSSAPTSNGADAVFQIETDISELNSLTESEFDIKKQQFGKRNPAEERRADELRIALQDAARAIHIEDLFGSPLVSFEKFKEQATKLQYFLGQDLNIAEELRNKVLQFGENRANYDSLNELEGRLSILIDMHTELGRPEIIPGQRELILREKFSALVTNHGDFYDSLIDYALTCKDRIYELSNRFHQTLTRHEQEVLNEVENRLIAAKRRSETNINRPADDIGDVLDSLEASSKLRNNRFEEKVKKYDGNEFVKLLEKTGYNIKDEEAKRNAYHAIGTEDNWPKRALHLDQYLRYSNALNNLTPEQLATLRDITQKIQLISQNSLQVDEVFYYKLRNQETIEARKNLDREFVRFQRRLKQLDFNTNMWSGVSLLSSIGIPSLSVWGGILLSGHLGKSFLNVINSGQLTNATSSYPLVVTMLSVLCVGALTFGTSFINRWINRAIEQRIELNRFKLEASKLKDMIKSVMNPTLMKYPEYRAMVLGSYFKALAFSTARKVQRFDPVQGARLGKLYDRYIELNAHSLALQDEGEDRDPTVGNRIQEVAVKIANLQQENPINSTKNPLKVITWADEVDLNDQYFRGMTNLIFTLPQIIEARYQLTFEGTQQIISTLDKISDTTSDYAEKDNVRGDDIGEQFVYLECPHVVIGAKGMLGAIKSLFK